MQTGLIGHKLMGKHLPPSGKQRERERVAAVAEEFHKICESATNYNGKYWSEMSADCLSLVQLHRRHSHFYSHSHSDCRAQQQKSRPKTKFMSALCVPSPTLCHSLSLPLVKERCPNCVTLFVSNFNKFARHLWPFVQIFNLFLCRSLSLYHFSRAFVVCLLC